jgi:hypothetical protein
MKEQKQRLGTIKISEFALRHFDPKFVGTKILNMEPKEFEVRLNTSSALYFDSPKDRSIRIDEIRVNILDGYAPFCKLLVMKNYTDAKTGSLKITDANYGFLRHGYSARREDELAVFGRWFDFPPGIEKPRAKYTISILYSKAQMDKELKSDYDKKMSKGGIDSIGLEGPEEFGADWGVVAILGQMTPKEEPMKPITMMRNYMDISMGGSGMKIPASPVEPNHFDFDDEIGYNMALNSYKEDVSKYKEEVKEFNETYERSVKFWQHNATVK